MRDWKGSILNIHSSFASPSVPHQKWFILCAVCSSNRWQRKKPPTLSDLIRACANFASCFFGFSLKLWIIACLWTTKKWSALFYDTKIKCQITHAESVIIVSAECERIVSLDNYNLSLNAELHRMNPLRQDVIKIDAVSCPVSSVASPHHLRSLCICRTLYAADSKCVPTRDIGMGTYFLQFMMCQNQNAISTFKSVHSITHSTVISMGRFESVTMWLRAKI